jgi:hypothetical protein
MSDMNRHWLTGLFRSGITGASTAASVMLSQVVVTEHIAWRVIGLSVLITSGLRLAEYLRRHPLPGIDGDDMDTLAMKKVQ